MELKVPRTPMAAKVPTPGPQPAVPPGRGSAPSASGSAGSRLPPQVPAPGVAASAPQPGSPTGRSSALPPRPGEVSVARTSAVPPQASTAELRSRPPPLPGHEELRSKPPPLPQQAVHHESASKPPPLLDRPSDPYRSRPPPLPGVAAHKDGPQGKLPAPSGAKVSAPPPVTEIPSDWIEPEPDEMPSQPPAAAPNGTVATPGGTGVPVAPPPMAPLAPPIVHHAPPPPPPAPIINVPAPPALPNELATPATAGHEIVIPTPAIASAVTVPASPAALSSREDLDDDQPFGRRPKRARWAAAAAFLLGLGAVGLWSALHAKSAEPGKAAATSTVAPTPVAAPVPPPRAEPTAVPDPSPPNPEPQAAAQPTAEKTPSPAAPAPDTQNEARSARGSKTATGSPPPRSSPGASKGGEAKGEGEASEPGAPVAPSKGHSTVDDEALQVAVAQATERAKGCRIEGGPTGVAHVSVTFAPSGDVIGANVQGSPFAHTLEGECIAAKFRALHVPPFSGNDVTVRKSVSIQ
ncbi:MAG TPA: hypothetical protein VF881_17475 [Polyangiaceae bacterium]